MKAVLAGRMAVLGFHGLRSGEAKEAGGQGRGEGEQGLAPRGGPAEGAGEAVESLALHLLPPGHP